MTIRNKDMYVARLWDWGFLDECFRGTRIRVTDIDGLVERNGRFLLIEAKGIGVSVPVGQTIMFQQLVDTGAFTILVLWGEPSEPRQMSVFPEDPKSCGTSDVQAFVSTWFRWANGQTVRRQETEGETVRS